MIVRVGGSGTKGGPWIAEEEAEVLDPGIEGETLQERIGIPIVATVLAKPVWEDRWGQHTCNTDDVIGSHIKVEDWGCSLRSALQAERVAACVEFEAFLGRRHIALANDLEERLRFHMASTAAPQSMPRLPSNLKAPPPSRSRSQLSGTELASMDKFASTTSAATEACMELSPSVPSVGLFLSPNMPSSVPAKLPLQGLTAASSPAERSDGDSGCEECFGCGGLGCSLCKHRQSTASMTMSVPGQRLQEVDLEAEVVDNGESADSQTALEEAPDLVPLNFSERLHVALGRHSARSLSALSLVDEPACCSLDSMVRVIQSASFESFFAAAITINTVFMAVRVQYIGLESGFKMDFPGMERSAEEAWPNADQILTGVEYSFGALFTGELLFKAVALRRNFFMQAWNIFDTLIVVFWFVDILSGSNAVINPMLIRLLRLGRLLRILRLVRSMDQFAPLILLIRAMAASVYILLWAMVLLVLVQMIVAMFLSQVLEDYVLDNSKDVEAKIEVYTYFGTFTRAMLTTFEMTLGNWVPACRLLMENVSEWYALFFIVYKLAVGFAMLGVIRGVFLHETFKVAHSDDEVMVMQKRRSSQIFVEKLRLLFIELDDSGDGFVSWEEFDAVISTDRVTEYLSALDLEVGEVHELFKMLDHGDGQISFDEFLEGVKRLKGEAKSMDLVKLQADVNKMCRVMVEVAHELDIDPKQAMAGLHKKHRRSLQSTAKSRASKISSSARLQMASAGLHGERDDAMAELYSC